MAATPGSTSLVSCSTSSGGTYDEVSGIKEMTTDTGIDMLDVTAFSDVSGSGGWRSFIAGLRGATISMSGRFERTDTGAAKILSVANGSYTALFLKALPDGTNGYRYEVLLTKATIKSAVDNYVDATYEFQVTGAAVAVP